jgi:hypothetical protein
VRLVQREDLTSFPRTVATGEATVAPAPCTQAGTYRWWLDDLPRVLRVRAEVEGFGQPQYSWRVQGTQLTATATTLPTTAVVDVDDPNAPGHPRSATVPVQATCTLAGDVSDYHGMADELEIAIAGFPGHVHLTVAVDVIERFVPGAPSGQAVEAVVDTQALRYESRYYDDAERCWKALEAIFSKLVHYRRIQLVLTLPDPPPDVVSAVALLKGLGAELIALRREQPELAKQLLPLLTARLGGASMGSLEALAGEAAQGTSIQ